MFRLGCFGCFGPAVLHPASLLHFYKLSCVLEAVASAGGHRWNAARPRSFHLVKKKPRGAPPFGGPMYKYFF